MALGNVYFSRAELTASRFASSLSRSSAKARVTAVEGRDALPLAAPDIATGCRDDAVMANPHSIKSFMVLFLENVNLA